MTHLVKRLRLARCSQDQQEAADRIEQLEAALQDHQNTVERIVFWAREAERKPADRLMDIEYSASQQMARAALGQERGKKSQEDDQPLDGTVKFPL